MRRDYPARRYLFAGIVDPPGLRAAPQLAASPVHHDATLRLPTIKLTDAEVEGRRRLLLEFIVRLPTEEEARQYVVAVRLLVDLLDELEAQALGAFHDAREAEKAAAETRRRGRRESRRGPGGGARQRQRTADCLL